uniref:Uncharacterized protein n=1 Tax=Ditylenchus dipsaci TaxID=166011 RepID=A0A915CWI3_9BILA
MLDIKRFIQTGIMDILNKTTTERSESEDQKLLEFEATYPDEFDQFRRSCDIEEKLKESLRPPLHDMKIPAQVDHFFILLMITNLF